MAADVPNVTMETDTEVLGQEHWFRTQLASCKPAADKNMEDKKDCPFGRRTIFLPFIFLSALRFEVFGFTACAHAQALPLLAKSGTRCTTQHDEKKLDSVRNS